MKHSLASILLASALIIMGCATPYQTPGYAGGYRDFRISRDTFEVSFSRNAYTSPLLVSRYVLRRASEVTLAHGFTHFERLSETNRMGPTRIRCLKNPLSTENLINAREYLRYNFPKALEEFPDESAENPEGVEDGWTTRAN